MPERMKDYTGTESVRAMPLCNSSDLVDRGDAVPFDVVYCGRVSRGFAIRFEGQVFGYLNQCSHVPMEMDYQPNRFFDSTGQWLMCATHGAMYRPQTGECRAGPCRGGLIKIALSELNDFVHWHTASNLQPIEF
jgi:nitrite reductase/ring-hydroxylating ferredoxin subunit